MEIRNVFKRYELKYVLTEAEYAHLLPEILSHTVPDVHGRSTVVNVYYDTPNHRLIRRSIEKPIYKEKIRLRSYGVASGSEPVFVELKKKYDSLVYKRRIYLPCDEAIDCMEGKKPFPDSQIGREIASFCDFYGELLPMMFLSYDREAYYGKDTPDLRITFDHDLRYRIDDPSISRPGGVPILDGSPVIMEIKIANAMPLWLSSLLAREHIYRRSFSKYGTAYQREYFGYVPKISEVQYV